MESFVGMLIAKLVSPISIVITLILTYFFRNKWIIPVAAIVAATVVEVVLFSMQHFRTLGPGYVIGILGSSIHAGFFYWLFNRKKS